MATSPISLFTKRLQEVQVGECGVRFVKEDDDDKLCFEDKDLAYNSM
jgi:hypothetical protein